MKTTTELNIAISCGKNLYITMKAENCSEEEQLEMLRNLLMKSIVPGIELRMCQGNQARGHVLGSHVDTLGFLVRFD